MKQGFRGSMLRPSLVALAAALLAGAAERSAQADEVVIEIRDHDGGMQYIQQGTSGQFPVEVFVGDTVKWVDTTGDDHTATSDVRGADDQPLFNVPIPANRSGSREFKQADFDAFAKALNAPMNADRLHLGYYCDIHEDSMGSKLVFKPASERAKSRERKEKAAD